MKTWEESSELVRFVQGQVSISKQQNAFCFDSIIFLQNSNILRNLEGQAAWFSNSIPVICVAYWGERESIQYQAHHSW